LTGAIHQLGAADPYFNKRQYLVARNIPPEVIDFAVARDQAVGLEGKAVVWIATQVAKGVATMENPEQWDRILQWVKKTRPDITALKYEEVLEPANALSQYDPYQEAANQLQQQGVPPSIISFAIERDRVQNTQAKLVPWIAREIVNKRASQSTSLNEWADVLDWAMVHYKEINNHTYPEVKEELRRLRGDNWLTCPKEFWTEFETNIAEYKFPDGYYIRQLLTKKDLVASAQRGSWCIWKPEHRKPYFDMLKKGYKFFALASPNGMPHVMMHISPSGQFEQMQGHGDVTPDDYYRRYLYQWLQVAAPEKAKLTAEVLQNAVPTEELSRLVKDFFQKQKQTPKKTSLHVSGTDL
jgi:hypothetical protein